MKVQHPFRYALLTVVFLTPFSIHANNSADPSNHALATSSSTKVLNYPNGAQYHGEVKNQQRHGQGTMQWANGDRYDGMWRNDTPHGQGTKQYVDGSQYVGNFYEGQRQGNGDHTFPDGTHYTGQWDKDAPHGKGVFRFTGGDTYDGDVAQGLPDGTGIFSYTDGSRYKGQWHQGKRSGQGRLRYPNGDIYVGMFKNGHPDGKGTLTASDGLRYSGQFLAGAPHGKGTCTQNKETATCAYKNGKQTLYKVKQKRLPTTVAKTQHVAQPQLETITLPITVAPVVIAENSTPISSTPASKQLSQSQRPQSQPAKPTSTAIEQTTLPDEPIARDTRADTRADTDASTEKDAFITKLDAAKATLSGTYSAEQLHRKKSDVLFAHNFEQLNIDTELRTGWWRKDSSLFRDRLRLHARSGNLRVTINVHRFEGPGTYTLPADAISAEYQGKAMHGLSTGTHRLIVKNVDGKWLEGQLDISFDTNSQNGQPYAISNGIFRFNEQKRRNL